MLGSSPLARGLPHRDQRPRGPAGIIPARAGFTLPARRKRHRGWDHPRSRGVYKMDILTQALSLGSSPLARGLQPCGSNRQRHVGIIPARAGFTPVACGGAPQLGDHPRSRGVYVFPAAAGRPMKGSSPLARGLLPGTLRPEVSARIIPARAGFTLRAFQPSSRHRDHPRSRGVYDVKTGSGRPVLGSSPLARGLPGTTPDNDGGNRIIPARAGFTNATCSARKEQMDHPRSRGVYPRSGSVLWCGVGSSPLARGLLPGRCRKCSSGRDHPRSRGVYSFVVSVVPTRSGSSPLARGLPDNEFAELDKTGIIPARAGFTTGPRNRPAAPGDHPRSRGVYSLSCPCLFAVAGSSPLARGLQLRCFRVVRPVGIIPARAGFTRSAS